MKRNHRKADEGLALLTALIFISLALVIMNALFIRVRGENREVDEFVAFNNCLLGVESALASSLAELHEREDGLVGLDGWTPSEGTFELPTFETEGVTPLHLRSMPEVEFYALAQNWYTDGTDNNGDGVIDGEEEDGFFTVYAFARNGNVTRTAEVVVAGRNISPWNNAVFAGSGAAGGAIQGNCSLHGSVHILGDNVPVGGEALVVLDFMGASLVHNNYGIGLGPGPVLPNFLRNRVPPLPRTSFNGEDVETIEANFRVKHGLVSLNSASEIGEDPMPGSGIKTSMDGCYNTDGWTGQRIDENGDPETVISDNGWDAPYDLGNRVSMPTLSDEWRWPEGVECYDLGYAFEGVPGDTEPSPDGDDYRHDEFFSTLVDGAPYTGDVTIRTDQDFYLNLSRPGDADPTHRAKPDPANCIKGDDYLYYNAATNVLEMTGQVEINGNLTFRQAPSASAVIYYTGRAAILADGNVTLACSLLSCNDGNPADYVNSFPERNCLGVMARNNLYSGVGAQRSVMGAFYGQNMITSDKQTILMGTFVSNFINMGQQVPDVYQVPGLEKNLPFGMVGNFPLYIYVPISWRELAL